MKTYCWTDRRGVIGFGRVPPKDMLVIAWAESRPLRKAVEAQARHAYDGTSLLVPGVPEAGSEQVAINAVNRFASRIARALGSPEAPLELTPDTRVSIAEHDWERGLVEFNGVVVRRLSPTHVQVRVDDGLLIAAPIEACTVIEAERSAA
ncbi:hypothetical protein [Phreatobacter stygius]|uniref:hypothetical protein n=1 Tax=Phreatobacter stygius TaxID=1940610 RepID=UPI001B8BD3DE|nr:hypothetical protein [Phreatobacter stygius]